MGRHKINPTNLAKEYILLRTEKYFIILGNAQTKTDYLLANNKKINFKQKLELLSICCTHVEFS